MRQWLGVNPQWMCKNHLIGEYREHFTFYGTLKLKRSLDGYFRSNCLEPLSLQFRFNQLSQEMKNRGYKTKPLFFNPELITYLGHAKYIKINQTLTKKLLFSRCPTCREKYKTLNTLNTLKDVLVI
jgi:hypothetical protein